MKTPNGWIQSIIRATYEINSLIPRGTYSITVTEPATADGIQIAPNTNFTFTVDYAGAIGDTTPPQAPFVTACASTSQDTLSASWSANDPDSTITMYSYAIGTTSGGSDVVNWTFTTNTSFLRSGLGLIGGQKYYITVKARNAGGLWSEAGIPPAVIAGQATCSANFTYGILVSPSTMAQSGNPGGTVTYQVTVTNTGNTSDSFNVGVAAGWTTDAPATVRPLAAGAHMMISVVVHIPTGAAVGAIDTATITITSQGDPSKSDTIGLTTTVKSDWQIYLPCLFKR